MTGNEYDFERLVLQLRNHFVIKYSDTFWLQLVLVETEQDFCRQFKPLNFRLTNLRLRCRFWCWLRCRRRCHVWLWLNRCNFLRCAKLPDSTDIQVGVANRFRSVETQITQRLGIVLSLGTAPDMTQVCLHTQCFSEHELRTDTNVCHPRSLPVANVDTINVIVHIVSCDTETGQQEWTETVTAEHIECIHSEQSLLEFSATTDNVQIFISTCVPHTDLYIRSEERRVGAE